MKVAIVTAFPQDPGVPHGGVEAVSVNLVRALAKMGDLDVHVVTTDPERDRPEVVPWESATVHRLPRSRRHTLIDAVGPGRAVVQQRLRELGPDVVHAHDVYGLMVKGLAYPRVFTIHGFIYGDTLVSGQRFARLRSRIWRSVETRGWADQPHIISISPYVRERLDGIATGVIHDIDNPIAESCFEIERKERKGTVFSAALICPRKNTITLVEAFGQLIDEGVDAGLRLAGSVTEPAYGRRLRERITELGLDDRVKVLGRIDSGRVREELSAASIFALTSLEENSPMGIEEAMAAGVPVVTSNRCGMPYMVRHGETGYLVDPHDPADIARHMRLILEDDAERARQGARSREIALDRFHPDKVALRTRQVYERAASASRKVRGDGYV